MKMSTTSFLIICFISIMDMRRVEPAASTLGLIGLWPMSRGRGRDMSGWNNHGKVKTVVFGPGKLPEFQSSINFNGSERHLVVNPVKGLGGSFTVGAFVSVSRVKDSTPLFSFQNKAGTDSPFILSVTSLRKIRFLLQSSIDKTDFAVMADTWTFVGMAYNGSTGLARLWVDPMAEDITLQAGQLTGVGGATIGGSVTKGTTKNFGGLIGCVVMYNTALNLDDIVSAKGHCLLYDSSVIFDLAGLGSLPPSSILNTQPAISDVDCSRMCIENNSCLSYAFSTINKKCSLGSQSVTSATVSSGADEVYNFGAKLLN